MTERLPSNWLNTLLDDVNTIHHATISPVHKLSRQSSISNNNLPLHESGIQPHTPSQSRKSSHNYKQQPLIANNEYNNGSVSRTIQQLSERVKQVSSSLTHTRTHIDASLHNSTVKTKQFHYNLIQKLNIHLLELDERLYEYIDHIHNDNVKELLSYKQQFIQQINAASYSPMTQPNEYQQLLVQINSLKQQVDLIHGKQVVTSVVHPTIDTTSLKQSILDELQHSTTDNSVLQQNYDMIVQRMTQLESRQNQSTQKIADLQSTVSVQQQHIEQLTQQIDALQQKYNNVQLNNVRPSDIDHSIQLDTLTEQISILSNSITEYKQQYSIELNSLKQHLQLCTTEFVTESQQSQQRTELNDMIEQLACHVDDQHSTIQHQYKQLNEHVMEHTDTLTRCNDGLQSIINVTKPDIEQLQQQCRQHTESIQSHQHSIDRVEQHQSSTAIHDIIVEHTEQIGHHHTQINQLQSILAALTASHSHNECVAEFEKLNELQQHHNTTIQQLNHEIIRLQQLSSVSSFAQHIDTVVHQLDQHTESIKQLHAESQVAHATNTSMNDVLYKVQLQVDGLVSSVQLHGTQHRDTQQATAQHINTVQLSVQQLSTDLDTLHEACSLYATSSALNELTDRVDTIAHRYDQTQSTINNSLTEIRHHMEQLQQHNNNTTVALDMCHHDVHNVQGRLDQLSSKSIGINDSSPQPLPDLNRLQRPTVIDEIDSSSTPAPAANISTTLNESTDNTPIHQIQLNNEPLTVQVSNPQTMYIGISLRQLNSILLHNQSQCNALICVLLHFDTTSQQWVVISTTERLQCSMLYDTHTSNPVLDLDFGDMLPLIYHSQHIQHQQYMFSLYQVYVRDTQHMDDSLELTESHRIGSIVIELDTILSLSKQYTDTDIALTLQLNGLLTQSLAEQEQPVILLELQVPQVMSPQSPQRTLATLRQSVILDRQQMIDSGLIDNDVSVHNHRLSITVANTSTLSSPRLQVRDHTIQQLNHSIDSMSDDDLSLDSLIQSHTNMSHMNNQSTINRSHSKSYHQYNNSLTRPLTQSMMNSHVHDDIDLSLDSNDDLHHQKQNNQHDDPHGDFDLSF